MKKLTTEEVIKRFIEKNGNKYDYSKVNYINTYTPVTIICPIHGEFKQKPSYHLSGCGCQKCSMITSHYEDELYKFICSLITDEIIVPRIIPGHN